MTKRLSAAPEFGSNEVIRRVATRQTVPGNPTQASYTRKGVAFRGILMKRVLIVLCACASWLGACGSSPPQRVEQTSVSPKASVVGRLIDAATQQPIEGVSVTTLGVDGVVQTKADGTFRVDGIIAGSTVTFIFEKAGYLRATRQSTLPNAAGDSPLEGGVTTFTAELFPANCAVGGFVFLPNGKGAPGATVNVDQRVTIGAEAVASTVTQPDGSFLVSGLGCRSTGTFHTVVAQWFDENQDMQADYATISSSIQLFPGQPGRLFLTYVALPGGNRVIASNVADGEITSSDELSFTFASALLMGSLDQASRDQFQLTNLTRSTTVPVEGSYPTPTSVRIRPALGSLREGERYRIVLSLRNATAETSGTIANSFTVSYEFQVRPARVTGFSAQATEVTVANPNPITPFGPSAFDFNSNAFVVSFNAVRGATRYEVYARDSTNNPNFVFRTNLDADGSTRYSVLVSLPAAFDASTTSPGIEPLAFGNRVTFAVAPVDVFGNRAPLMMAAPVEVKDTIPPRVSPFFSVGVVPNESGQNVFNGFNTTSSPQVWRLRIVYSEPMDTAATSAPTLTTNAVNPPMSSFSVDPQSPNVGILSVTVPPNGDSTGSFVIRGGKDSAGNEVTQNSDIVGSFGGRRELLVNGQFQASPGACSLMGWAPSIAGAAPMPVALDNTGAVVNATSGCAAVLGAVPGTMPATGRIRLSQDAMIPPLPSALGYLVEASVRAKALLVVNPNAPSTPSVTTTCRIETPGVMPMVFPLSGVGGANRNDIVYALGTSANLFGLNGQIVRFACEIDLGPTAVNAVLYLDEASLAVIKLGTL
jgi:hypothetical protein